MSVARPMTKCPFCLEPIAAGAKRCKHCQADLGEKTSSGTSKWRHSFRTGFLVGVAFSIILAILIYGHFNWSY